MLLGMMKNRLDRQVQLRRTPKDLSVTTFKHQKASLSLTPFPNIRLFQAVKSHPSLGLNKIIMGNT